MQEYQVTVGGVRHALERPLFVLATQNPIEQEGTYPLPEAQLDRFMLNVVIDYPTAAEERAILAQTTTGDEPRVAAVATGDQIERARLLVREIRGRRQRDRLRHAAGPREPRRRRGGDRSQARPTSCGSGCAGAPARAPARRCCWPARPARCCTGRPAVSLDDVRAVAAPVLRHRLLVNFQAEADGIDAETMSPNSPRRSGRWGSHDQPFGVLRSSFGVRVVRVPRSSF